ncbi:MAG: glycosyltransferase family 2 protein [Deltaproteobacteria bacterium]|nr:glycosyltransferase family 2 protein [Deltaproteobacteria bacterium]
MHAILYFLKIFFKGIDLSGWAPIGLQLLETNATDALQFRADLAGNADAGFCLKQTLSSGWYIIEFAIEKNDADAARLFFNLGHGFNERDSILVPYKNGIQRKRFFQIPRKCSEIRFAPVEEGGEFILRQFRLKRVFSLFAWHRIKRKLKNFRSERLPKDPLNAYERLFDKPVALHYDVYLKEIEPMRVTPNLAACDTVISILMPVYNPEPDMLRQTIESVLKQTYPHFELCIADDASSLPGVHEVLNQFVDGDDRIKITFRSENGHISRASNSALQLCTGKYVALMDHDDLLPPHALNEVALFLCDHPDANIVYSDEDKINPHGKRTEPYFKPDWNPDLLYSQNYISHLSVYRRELLERIGGFRVGFEGAQDHDLILRCVRACNEDGIFHIPKILYHWRAGSGSTALAASQKEYTSDAGIRAVQEALGENVASVTQGKYPNTYRVHWPTPVSPPLVSLIMPTHNGRDITKQAIHSILSKTDYPEYEIIVVDNQSDDPRALHYFDKLTRHDRISVIKYPKNFNFSAINNFAVPYAKGSILGFINNDIEVINDGWLTEMVSHAMRPQIGCVGAKLYYPDGRLQHAGCILGIGGVAGHGHKYFNGSFPGYFSRAHLTQDYSAVTAACLIVQRHIFEAVEGFDETNLAVAFNDIDFCLKVIKKGYRNLWTPYAELYHHESLSRGTEDSPLKLKRFQRESKFMQAKWGEILQNDPAYNVNLTLEHEDFSISAMSDKYRKKW